MVMQTAEKIKVESGGRISLSSYVLEMAGVHDGDSLVMETLAPGIIQLRKLPVASDQDAAAIRKQLRQALIDAGYKNREDVIRLVREIRQEIAQEQ